MPTIEKVREEIKRVFGKRQADVLVDFLDILDETVKVKDFNELKAIVSELATAQKELASAQKRTEQRVEELANAQKRTEEEIRNLVIGLSNVREEIGGLGNSIGYSFENEAYRMLPKVLRDRYGIELEERFVREEIGGKEINIFGRGKRGGKEVLIIGEVKLNLENKRADKIFRDLDEKVEVVRGEYKGVEILRVLVTHYASKGFLRMAEERGIIVVQSFEW